MKIIRFVWFLISPVLATLALPLLLVVWLLLAVSLGLMNTWFRATKDPRYREYGITEFDR